MSNLSFLSFPSIPHVTISWVVVPSLQSTLDLLCTAFCLSITLVYVVLHDEQN